MDPFSLVVGTLTLVQLCIKSSSILHGAIKDIKANNQEIRLFLAELNSLLEVLQALERSVKEDAKTFESLNFVLEQCTSACDNLNEAVGKAFKDSKQQFEGIKVWIRLKRHAGDIEAFKKLVDSYKATLTIAVADANLRTARVTKGLLEEYTELSKRTTTDLEERIEELSVKLELLHSDKNYSSMKGMRSDEERQTLDQKTSLEQCLSICMKLIEHIQTVRPTACLDSNGDTHDATKDSSRNIPRMTNDVLDVCTQSLSNAAQHIKDIAEDDHTKTEMDEAELLRQLGGAQRCLEILRKSERDRVNIFEKIEQSEDSQVAMISTIGDLIRGRDIKIGPRAISLMGQMSDESFQFGVGNFTSSAQGKPKRLAADKPTAAFEQKHGSGRKI